MDGTTVSVQLHAKQATLVNELARLTNRTEADVLASMIDLAAAYMLSELHMLGVGVQQEKRDLFAYAVKKPGEVG